MNDKIQNLVDSALDKIATAILLIAVVMTISSAIAAFGDLVVYLMRLSCGS